MSEEQNYSRYEDEYEDDEIDIIELIRKLLGNWKKLLLWALAGLAVGIVVDLGTVRTYTVNTKMAPEVAVKGGGSSLGSLASLAGVNLSSGSGTDAVYPSLYPNIVASTPFRVELFSLPVEFSYKKEAVSTDLYDYILHYTKESWLSVALSFPKKAIKAVKRTIKGKRTAGVQGYADVDPYELTSEQSRVAHALAEGISLSVDKKDGSINTSVTMQDPHVAAALATEVMNRLQKYVADYRTEKARHDLVYFEQLRDAAREEFYSAQQKYARYVDANQGVVLQRVKIEQERLQNESNLKFQIYNQTEQQVQAAKAKVQQDTPVCAVIQPASVPRNSSPSSSKILFVAVLLAVIIGAFWILLGKDFVEKIKTPSKPEADSSEE